MRRFFAVLAIVALVSAGLTSCKSSEKCPAYGQVSEELPEDTRA